MSGHFSCLRRWYPGTTTGRLLLKVFTPPSRLVPSRGAWMYGKISQSRLSINSAPWCRIHARMPPQLLAWSQSFLFSCSQPGWLSRTSVQTTQSQAIQSASQKHDCWPGGIAPCTPSLLHPARWKCPVEAGVEWGVSYSSEVSCQVQKGNSSFFWRKALDWHQKLFKTTHWYERALKQQMVCSCCFLHLLSS